MLGTNSSLHCLAGIMIETLESLLSLLVFNLDDLQYRLDAAEAFLFRQVGRITGLVLTSAIVLDLLAGIFDLGEPQGCRGAFEEMAIGAEFLQVPILPVGS